MNKNSTYPKTTTLFILTRLFYGKAKCRNFLSHFYFNKAVLVISLLFVLASNSDAQPFIKSGKVYEDYNGNGVPEAPEPGTNAAGMLCAYLLDNSSNIILDRYTVAPDGSYTFSVPSALPAGNYLVAIANCSFLIGSVFNGGPVTYNTGSGFPPGWSMVYPLSGTWINAGNGSNSTANNFFIRRLPFATADLSTQITDCSPSSCVSIPGLSGTSGDNSLPAYNITGFKILSMAGGNLKTGGTTISAGQILTLSQAGSLCFTKSAGALEVATIKYAAVNNASGKDYVSQDTAGYAIKLGAMDFRRDIPSSILLACNSQSAQLSAPFTTDTTGMTFTYSWTGPNGFSSTIKSPVLAPDAAVEDALYIVTATDQAGCRYADTLKAKKMSCFLPCDNDNAYLAKGNGSVNGGTFYRYNIPTQTATVIASNLPTQDAICFNPYNNLIYGYGRDNSSRHIYVTDVAGKTVDLDRSTDAFTIYPTMPAGAAGPNGRWYLGAGLITTALTMVDLVPSSPTYMRFVGTIPTVGVNFGPYDFAWSDCDQMLYGVQPPSSSPLLYQMNPVTGVVTTFPTNLPTNVSSFGAQFMDNNCNLYVNEGPGRVFMTSLATPPTGTINFTQLSDFPSSSTSDAAISPFKPSDYGDAPASYGIANHRFTCIGGPGGALLYLGSNIDYEPTSLYSNDAKGDDNINNGISTNSKDDGLLSYSVIKSCIPVDTFSVTVNMVNNTGTNATLSAWVDFNQNGVFDLSERQQATIANNQTSVTLHWSGIASSYTPGVNLFVRLRIGTGSEVDNPTGVAKLGEVEDYVITVMGVDQGDNPSATYGQPLSYVYPDLNGDNLPDDPAAIWLGNIAQGKDGNANCSGIYDSFAAGDDNEGVNDEDGYVASAFRSGPTTLNFTANGNSTGQTAYYAIWIDWDKNGFENTASEFYTGSYVTGGSAVVISQPITIPATISSMSLMYMRFRVFTSPLGFADYNSVLFNSETEDYFVNNALLPVSLSRFTLEKKSEDGVLLSWQTGFEQDNHGFNVQHSMDGNTWKTVAFVKGAGNSDIPNDYHNEQNGLKPGIHYYRIQQVRLDGYIKSSEIKKTIIAKNETLRVYPNPVNDKLFIANGDMTKKGDITVYNSSGSVALVKKAAIGGEPISIQQLPPGIYILKVSYSDQPPVYRKIVKE